VTVEDMFESDEECVDLSTGNLNKLTANKVTDVFVSQSDIKPKQDKSILPTKPVTKHKAITYNNATIQVVTNTHSNRRSNPISNPKYKAANCRDAIQVVTKSPTKHTIPIINAKYKAGNSRDTIQVVTNTQPTKLTIPIMNAKYSAANIGDTIQVVTNTPTPTTPQSVFSAIPSLARVKERLSSPSPAMISWHMAQHMREMKKGLDMTTSICTWHVCHAWSMENNRRTLSDRFRELPNVQEIEQHDGGSGYGAGGGGLSDRFGFWAERNEGRILGKRKRGEELGTVKNKILRKLSSKVENGEGEVEKRKERFGEVDQNFFDNVKYLSDRSRR